jgi:hypothetical protein
LFAGQSPPVAHAATNQFHGTENTPCSATVLAAPAGVACRTEVGAEPLGADAATHELLANGGYQVSRKLVRGYTAIAAATFGRYGPDGAEAPEEEAIVEDSGCLPRRAVPVD